MFDDYLRERADRTGERFVPFDAGEDYDEYVDGRPRYDGVRTFLASRGIHLPDGTPDDDPGTETVDGLGNRKNELVLELIARDGVEVYEGSVRYVRAARDAGLHRAVVSSSSNCRDVLEAAGILDLFEEIVDGVVATREGLKGKPAPDTFLAGARRARRGRAARGRVRGRRRGRRGGAGGRVRVRRRRRPGRPRRRAARARRGPRRPATSRSSWTRPARDRAPRLQRRAVGAARDRPEARRPRPERVAVRARQRPHRPARQPRRGRAQRAARHVPQRLPRDPAAAVRRDGLRQPRGGRDRPQRHRRQAHAAPRRRRALRRPLRRADRARARPRLPRRAPAAPRALALAGRRAGPGGLDAHRLARPARRRRDPLRGRARRRSHPRRRAVRADRQPGRPAAGARERGPARRRRDGGPAVRRGALPARPARAARPPRAPTAAC